MTLVAPEFELLPVNWDAGYVHASGYSTDLIPLNPGTKFTSGEFLSGFMAAISDYHNSEPL
jgi:hypothetical protein